MSALRIAHPGRPTELIRDVDPWAALTPRQRRVLEVVSAFNGNRSRAARFLRCSVVNVQVVLKAAARRGVEPPPIARRGPDLRPRSRHRYEEAA